MNANLLRMAVVATSLFLPSVSAAGPQCQDTPADGGNCRAYFTMWTYTEGRGCHLFAYGGCGGNTNRFPTQEDCQEQCQQGPLLNPLDSSAPGPCCPVKKCGSVTYNLVGREDIQFALKHGCLTDCIYTLGTSSQLVCLKRGVHLPEVPLNLVATDCSFNSNSTAEGEGGIEDPGVLQKTLLQLHATCDNTMKVYIDGFLQPEDGAMANWFQTSILAMSPLAQVLAIECLDLGAYDGILASNDNGILTDGSWSCSKVYVEGWTKPGFQDTTGSFMPALVIGAHGVVPWGVRPGIATAAQWIWTQETSTKAFCRKVLSAFIKEDGCPVAEPALGSPCTLGQDNMCTYGKECCCGECNHSLEVSCSDGRWLGRATDFCMLPPEIKCPNYTSPAYTKPPPADTRCPADQPDFGDACNLPEKLQCPYGKECCCGSCHPSLLLSCMGGSDTTPGTWGGLHTDACMRPDCGTTMATPPDNICSRIRCPADSCSTDPLGTCCCCSKASDPEEQLNCGKDSSSPPPDCICPMVVAPVCGTDGKDYGNQCQAGCSGAKPACSGRCPCKDTTEKPNCICIEIYQPVCGTDGRDYSNSCKAACHGMKPACEGVCPCSPVAACVCTADYSPVCGEDGKDYSNACQAGCGGGQTEVACEGTCPCKPPTLPTIGGRK